MNALQALFEYFRLDRGACDAVIVTLRTPASPGHHAHGPATSTGAMAMLVFALSWTGFILACVVVHDVQYYTTHCLLQRQTP